MKRVHILYLVLLVLLVHFAIFLLLPAASPSDQLFEISPAIIDRGKHDGKFVLLGLGGEGEGEGASVSFRPSIATAAQVQLPQQVRGTARAKTLQDESTTAVALASRAGARLLTDSEAIITSPNSSPDIRHDKALHNTLDSSRASSSAKNKKSRSERLKPPSMLQQISTDRMTGEKLSKSAAEEQRVKNVRLHQARERMIERVRRERGEHGNVVGNGREEEEEVEEEEKKEEVLEVYDEERERAERLKQLWRERKKNRMDQKEEARKALDTAMKKIDEVGTNPEEYFRNECQSTSDPLVECSGRPYRNLSEAEASGRDILFPIRTTLKYHESRLSVLFETWLDNIDPRSVYIVTDGEDEDLQWKTRTLGQ